MAVWLYARFSSRTLCGGDDSGRVVFVDNLRPTEISFAIYHNFNVRFSSNMANGQ